MKKYTLCITEKNNLFIESAKSKVWAYNRTDSFRQDRWGQMVNIFGQLEAYNSGGFEANTGNFCDRKPFDKPYRKLLDFNTKWEVLLYIHTLVPSYKGAKLTTIRRKRKGSKKTSKIICSGHCIPHLIVFMTTTKKQRRKYKKWYDNSLKLY